MRLSGDIKCCVAFLVYLSQYVSYLAKCVCVCVSMISQAAHKARIHCKSSVGGQF